MTDHPSDNRLLYAEIHELTMASLQGKASSEQMARLEEVLRSNASARKIYFAYIAETEVLRTWASQTKDDLWDIDPNVIRELLDEDELAALQKAKKQARIEIISAEKLSAFQREGDHQHRPELVQVPRSVFYATVSTLAAVAIVGILLFIGRGAEPICVAKITGEYQLKSAEGDNRSSRYPSFFAGDRVSVEEGLIEITFADGAVVVLEGPSEFVIDSAGAGRLNAGLLTAQVPEIAQGFTIETASVRVVDLGTEFAVAAMEDGQVDVQVLVGSVVFNTLPRDGGVTTTVALDTGHGRHISAAGEISDLQAPIPLRFAEGRSQFADRWKVSLPYQEDFSGCLLSDFYSDPQDDWSLAEDQLHVESPLLRAGHVSGLGVLVEDDLRRQAIEVSVTVRVLKAIGSNSDVGLALFGSSPGFELGASHYVADFKPDGTFRLSEGFNGPYLAKGKFSYRLNVPYRLVVVASPVDGGLKIDFTIEDPDGDSVTISAVAPRPLKGRCFGFRTRTSGGGNQPQVIADFDNFRISRYDTDGV